MRVFVTGAAGFVASRLSKALLARGPDALVQGDADAQVVHVLHQGGASQLQFPHGRRGRVVHDHRVGAGTDDLFDALQRGGVGTMADDHRADVVRRGAGYGCIPGAGTGESSIRVSAPAGDAHHRRSNDPCADGRTSGRPPLLPLTVFAAARRY